MKTRRKIIPGERFDRLIVIKICNIAKSNMDQKDFIEWLQRAANHTKAMADQWSKYLCELPEND